MSTVHVRVAGVASTLPALSRARTCKVWLPCDSPVYVIGSVQPVKVAPSSAHSYVTPLSLESKSNVASVEAVVPDGPLTMVVSGATVSTVHVRVAGVPSTLPALSRARTASVWLPWDRLLNVAGEVHAANVPPSRLHSKSAGVSVEVKANVALFEFVVPVGPEVMLVSGATVSTVQVRLAGVASKLPAASTARTCKVWLPCDKPGKVTGSVHAAKGAPSSEHWYVTASSLELKSNVALALFVRPLGPLTMVVSGATVSTTQVRLAGVGSTLPAASRARTWNVWEPWASPV
ncbi:hypothetical protein VZP55_30365 [Myxococcus faecalis]